MLEADHVGLSDIRVYEFGVRLDPESDKAADDQIWRSRHLYNDLIALMRRVYDEMQVWVLERAGAGARELNKKVDALTEQFAAARAANDEAAMRTVAAERRAAWRELAQALGLVRKEHATDLRKLFYARIGNNSTTDTYQLRCKAVDDGLGWATATRALDRALMAWKASMKIGRPPRFARADEIQQDTLTLQFTVAGGVAAERLFDGSHGELRLRPSAPAGRRSYGAFEFRLGAAKAGTYAAGTWQYHRPLPQGAMVALAGLVRRRVANKYKWAIQLVLRNPNHQAVPSAPLRTLAAVHMGWALDDTGRQVAGIAEAADPGLAKLVYLPDDLESDLARAQEIQGLRDRARDEAVDALKQIDADAIANLSDGDLAFFAGIKPLRPQYIAARKFYVAQAILRRSDASPAWLEKWVAEDRKAWQASVGIARRARARRRHFYRQVADELARTHSAVLVETLDLAAAALKIDEKSGERSEFAAAARRGRQVAALFELDQMIVAACEKYGRALFRMQGAPTVTTCAVCGGAHVQAVKETPREVECGDCGARGDRKLMGAACAWQMGEPGIEDRIVDYHADIARTKTEAKAAKVEKASKMAEGRRKAREAAEAARTPSEDAAT